MGATSRGIAPVLFASVLALSAGVSGFARGAYDIEVWGPAGMVLLGALVAAVLAIPSRPRSLALAGLVGLASLCGWSFLSTLWAESVDRALVDSYRLLAYVAAFGFLVLCLAAGHERLRPIPIAAGAAGVCAVALSVLVRLFADDAESLFVASRLNGPLGYFNAEGAFFILGFWPLLAAAVGVRSRVLRALAAGGAVVLVDLVVLTQSRGALGALVVSAAVLLALHRPRSGLAGALLAVALGVAVAVPALTDITGVAGAPGAEAQRSGAIAIVLGALLAAASHLAGGELARRLSGSAAVTRTLKVAGAVAVLVAAVAVAVVVGPRIGDEARAFKELRQPDPQARLFTAGGNRYDYWRVGWITFTRQPLRGVGAGNYDFTYFELRRTAEDIRQPHSLPLQTLAELGIVGGLVLAAFMLAVLAAGWRLARRGRETPAWVLAAGGMFLAWALHSAVDWTHLMPAPTVLALGAGAALLAPWPTPGELLERRPLRLAVVLVICAASLAGAGGLGRFARANELEDEAQSLIARDPGEAAARAKRALGLNGSSLRARYIRAAALARLGRPQRARVVLEDAAAREPHRFLTWALLGDLAVRRGELRAARRLYRRAARLNPRDESLRRLSSDGALLRQLKRNPEAPPIGG